MEGRNLEQKSPKEQSDALLARAQKAREERLARENRLQESGDGLPTEDISIEYKPTREEAERTLAQMKSENADHVRKNWSSSQDKMHRPRKI